MIFEVPGQLFRGRNRDKMAPKSHHKHMMHAEGLWIASWSALGASWNALGASWSALGTLLEAILQNKSGNRVAGESPGEG